MGVGMKRLSHVECSCQEKNNNEIDSQYQSQDEMLLDRQARDMIIYQRASVGCLA
jgi:hypothetical protein